MESLRSKNIQDHHQNYKKPSIRSKANINAPCKKHPKHKQSPGVCSICLSEKLSQLPNINNASSSKRAKGAKSVSLSSSSDLSFLSSSNPSSCSSPMVNYTCRLDLNARKSTKINLGGLKKSRSMTSIFRREKDQEDEFSGKKGFWSKLLPRKNKGLSMHSKTTRERSINPVQ